jgi:hypothetical protein
LIGAVGRNVSSGRLISSNHRPAPTSCIDQFCDLEFYTEVVKRLAT